MSEINGKSFKYLMTVSQTKTEIADNVVHCGIEVAEYYSIKLQLSCKTQNSQITLQILFSDYIT